MVDFQSISMTLAALSFVVAAIYYAMNLREVSRNRRITLTTTLLQPFMTKEGNRLLIDLFGIEWSSIEDYRRKYDHRVNPESYSERAAVWNRFNSIGMLYRQGLLDLNTLYAGTGGIVEVMWRKYKPVIEMYRATDMDEQAYEHWEYLADKMIKLRQPAIDRLI